MSAIRARTSAWVDFFIGGRNADPIRTYISGSESPQLHADGLRFSKNLGQPSGSMQVRYRGPAARKLIGIAQDRPAWWRLTISRDGVESEVAAGKVDGVSVSVTGPASSLQVVVEGRDVGGVFEDTPIWFNDFLQWGNNLGGRDMLRILKGRPAGSPADIVQAVTQSMLGMDGLMGGEWRLPNGLSEKRRRVSPEFFSTQVRMEDDFEGWINYAIDTAVQGETVAPAMLDAQGSQSLWAFLDGWRNPPLNEMFIDYIEQQPTLVLRQKPFVDIDAGQESPWFDVERHDVSLSETDHISLRSGGDRINFAMYYHQMTPFRPNEVYSAYLPVFNRQSIRDHGLRRLEEQSAFHDPDPNIGAYDTRSWRNLIVSWNALNPRMYSGQIAIRAVRPEIHIGHRVRLLNSGRGSVPTLPAELTFYVEGVQHAVDEGGAPSSTTVLTVTRGYDDDAVLYDLQTELSTWEDEFGEAVAQPPRADALAEREVEIA